MDVENDISYLEDMFLERIKIMTKRYKRTELNGQLRYLWDICTEVLKNNERDMIIHTNRLLKIKIEEVNYSEREIYTDEIKEIKSYLWERYNELKYLKENFYNLYVNRN